jgi:hypothetical protein
MIQPGKYDITIYQGATFELPVQYKDNLGTPVNMSGYTISGTLWDRLGNNKLATFSTPYVSQPSGMFTMRLEATTTSGITGQGQYDVLVTTAAGDQFYLLEGNAFWNPGLSWRADS